MNRTEFLPLAAPAAVSSSSSSVFSLREALRRLCTRRHAALVLKVALPYLVAAAVLLLR